MSHDDGTCGCGPGFAVSAILNDEGVWEWQWTEFRGSPDRFKIGMVLRKIADQFIAEGAAHYVAGMSMRRALDAEDAVQRITGGGGE